MPGHHAAHDFLVPTREGMQQLKATNPSVGGDPGRNPRCRRADRRRFQPQCLPVLKRVVVAARISTTPRRLRSRRRPADHSSLQRRRGRASRRTRATSASGCIHSTTRSSAPRRAERDCAAAASSRSFTTQQTRNRRCCCGPARCRHAQLSRKHRGAASADASMTARSPRWSAR